MRVLAGKARISGVKRRDEGPARIDADNHLATLNVGLRPGTYQLVVTTGITDINGVAVAQEYDAPLVISR